MTNSTDQSSQSPRGSRFRILDDVQVENLPPPEWLIDDVLPAKSLAVLYGPPGDGKTFTSLDWAFSLATGSSWAGRTVKQGAVIYIAAEGVAGIGVRVRAVKQERGVAGQRVGVGFVGEAVSMVGHGSRYLGADFEDVNAFIEAVRPLQPVLIVVDTLARCMFGADEDSARDMGLFIDAVGRIRTALNTTVLIVHHPGKKASSPERGSGALRGGVETVIRLTRSGDQVILTCIKQKDGGKFKPIQLTLRTVTLSNGDTSCVLAASGPGTTTAGLDQRLRRTLEALAKLGDGPIKAGAWKRAIDGADRTFHDHQKKLLAAGYVEKKDKGEYVITESGRALLSLDQLGKSTATANPVQPHCNGSSPSTTAATALPPLGGAVQKGFADPPPTEHDLSLLRFTAEKFNGGPVFRRFHKQEWLPQVVKIDEGEDGDVEDGGANQILGRHLKRLVDGGLMTSTPEGYLVTKNGCDVLQAPAGGSDGGAVA